MPVCSLPADDVRRITCVFQNEIAYCVLPFNIRFTFPGEISETPVAKSVVKLDEVRHSFKEEAEFLGK